jgi:predicted esterase YcpF (UPF0227 family)
MLEHTGFYLPIEIGKKSKILNALFKAHDLINGVMIKMPFWLAESIEAINEIKSIVKEKRVLVDLRLGGYSAEDIRYFSSMIGD